MNTNLMLNTLKSIQKGQWFKMSFTGDLPLTADAKREGYVAYKRTVCTVRYGINYMNIGTVKQRFEDKAAKGEMVEKHELSWGSWVAGHEGVLIEHKNNTYLRVYTSPNAFKSEYFVNGMPITKEGLMTLGIIQPSYFKKKETRPEALTIKTANIETIG